MRAYRREAERLKEAVDLVEKRYPRLGVNKSREITRLIYEISKRENLPPSSVLPPGGLKRFAEVKASLLERRFPEAGRQPAKLRPYLPAFDLSPDNVFKIRETAFSPKEILVEEGAGGSTLSARFRKTFPKAIRREIPSLKEYLKKKRGGGPAAYNRRRETVLIVNERHDFFKRCPCTSRAVPCGYHILNLSFGCLFECTYCYLQEYTNSSGLIFPANLDRFFDHFSKYRSSSSARGWQRGPYLRVGTGEFSDSLMLDRVTEYSIPLVEYFNRQKDVRFEFKTKSANVENLLKIRPAGNIVVAWSLNPRKIIEESEFYAAPLADRLEAAARCAEAGYKLAFHFDPVFCFPGWEGEYAGVIEELFARVRPGDIVWISLGTLRFKPALKKVIEARFPGNLILDAELLLDWDGKLRYPEGLRHEIYEFLIREFKKYSPRLPLYLCMEDTKMWEALKLPFPFR